MKTDQQLIFQSSKNLKKTLKLSFFLSSMLSTFEKSIIENGNHTQSSNKQFFEGNSQLYIAFNTLMRKEKIYHYSLCVEFLNSITNDKSMRFDQVKFEIPVVSLTAYRKSGLLGFSEKTMVVVDNQHRKLSLISSGKKQDKINLRNYLMRESKDNKKRCLIFQSVVKYEYRTTIRLYFEERSYGQAKIILRRLLDEVEKQKLYEEVIKGIKLNPIRTPETSNSLSTPENGFLNKQNLKVFYNLFETLKQNEEESGLVERQSILNCSYKNITTNGNTYYLQQLFTLQQEEMIKVLTSKEHTWNSLVCDSVLVEASKSQRVFAEKYLFNGIKYSTTYLMSKKEDNNGRFLLKSIKNEKSKDQQLLQIQFVYVNLIKITSSTTQLLIKAKMNTGDSNRSGFIIQFLKQFENIYQALILMKQNFAEEHNLNCESKHFQQTVYLDANGDEEDLISNFCCDDEISQIERSLSLPFKDLTLTDSINFTSQNTDISEDFQCLKHQHMFHPLKNAELKILKQHYLDAEWVRAKAGGLVCINQRIMSEQNKVLKHVFTSLGKNLFSNKSIMNVSLPASVCTKFSHLKMIANNFTYAPLLVEEAIKLNPLQRMKKMVSFLITIGNTGISSQKPFNPILGETFEGSINGCPIYLEQVSHHPPASAYLFEGRGYKINGVIQPKVQPSGLNSVRCFSQKQNRLTFEDGSVLYMSYPRIILTGLLYGKRGFHFSGKNFIFDQKNMLYAELNFGQQKFSYFGTSSDPVDMVCGKIYKVKPSLTSLFNSSKRKEIVLKDHIEKELCQFDGTWTQKLNFNGEEYFNFRTELPCVLEQKGTPLPSDSQFRTDIQRLIENNLKEAQFEKQRLEELQRKDKVLREKYRAKKWNV